MAFLHWAHPSKGSLRSCTLCLYQHGIFTVLFAYLYVKIMIKTLKKHEEVTPFLYFCKCNAYPADTYYPKKAFALTPSKIYENGNTLRLIGPVALILLLCLSAPSVILVRRMYILRFIFYIIIGYLQTYYLTPYYRKKRIISLSEYTFCVVLSTSWQLFA